MELYNTRQEDNTENLKKEIKSVVIKNYEVKYEKNRNW